MPQGWNTKAEKVIVDTQTGATGMADQPQVKRRLFLAEPGEQPILTRDPIEYIERFDRFVEATGIVPERVLSTPLVNVPLPVAMKAQDDTIQRWSGIDPAMMWLPLFWLPPHLALRYKYRVIDPETGGDSGDFQIESDEVWAMRVMLELTYSGLYSPVDGTWGDVLSFYGLDVENPVDQARVQMWLSGNPDEVLDSIDLTDHILNAEDPEWALVAARHLADTAVPAQWSLSAGGLLVAISQQLAFVGDSDAERRKLITVMGNVASNSLRSVPADPETGMDIVDVVEAIVSEAQRPAADSSYLMDTFLQVLSDVTEDFNPYVDAMLPEELRVNAA